MERFKKGLLLLVCFLCCGVWVQGQAVSKAPVDLDFFVDNALHHSPLMKDYHNQLLMNKIDSMRLKAGYKPQLNASSTGLYAPVIKGYGYDEALTNSHTLDALLTLNYGIITAGQKNNQMETIRLQGDSIRYATRLSELDLRKAITDQYIVAYASQLQLDFNRDISALLSKEEGLLKKLTRVNAYKQTEYLTFLVTFQQQQLQWKQAELQFKTDYALLNYLAGINDTTTTVLKEPFFNPVKEVFSGKSFFTRRFEIDSLKALNEKKAVDFNYRPKASVYANGGYNSSFVLQPYRNFGTSVGFTVSIPIYDGHQRKMQYNKVELQARTSSYYRSFFVQQQKQQMDMLHQQIKETDGLYKQINEQIRFTRSLIEADSKLLHTGDVKIADLVIAINNYMAAQNLLRQTNINRLKLINQLNYWNR